MSYPEKKKGVPKGTPKTPSKRRTPNLHLRRLSPVSRQRQIRQRGNRLRRSRLALRQSRSVLERFHQHLKRKVCIRANEDRRRQRPVSNPCLPSLRHAITSRDRDLHPPFPIS